MPLRTWPYFSLQKYLALKCDGQVTSKRGRARSREATENHWRRIGDGDLGEPVCILRAARFSAVDLLTRCPAARESILALTGPSPVSGWKWQERVGGRGLTQRGEWSTQDLRPPPVARPGPFPPTLRFRGLPGMQNSRPLCSQARFLTGSARRESSDEPENQPDLGLLCLCSYGVRMIGHTLGALITGVLPQPPRPEILLGSVMTRLIDWLINR